MVQLRILIDGPGNSMQNESEESDILPRLSLQPETLTNIGNINFEPEVPIEVLKAGTYHFISTDDKNGLLEMILSIEPL